MMGEELGCSGQYVMKLMRGYKIPLRAKAVAGRVGRRHGRFTGPEPKVKRIVDPGYIS